MDYIDACVFLAVVFGEEGDRCRDFLDRVGYRAHPAGVISHYVVSETFIAILTKRAGARRAEAFTLATKLLTRLQDERNLAIARLERDERLFTRLKEEEFRLTDDDAFHLVAAVRAGCDRFVTIDAVLLGAEQLRAWLRREHRLKLVSP